MYPSLRHCVLDLEKNGHLIRIKEEVDPNLEMAAIHLRVNEAKGPAIFYENVKGSLFPAVSNLFGTMERSRFIFRKTFENAKLLFDVKKNPGLFVKNPFKYLKLIGTVYSAFPQKSNRSDLYSKILIENLPQIKCWPDDGGAFFTLPQVYSESLHQPGIMNSNLGMYRIQISGNNYLRNKEAGLHYQIHRGIGIHQSIANEKGKPLKVSIFLGGPPAHPFAAVMPLPEGMTELTFAGIFAGRRFRYFYENGFLISGDADFVITGEVFPGETKPEGPFGDHLGYYSLIHNFPVMRVKNVYHRKGAIFPFTVVGRPPQEDSQFGALIHELTGSIIKKEIPGLKQLNAVDAAGVHPLLLAIGSERYTPFASERKPQEILTIANHILGTGQLSLAKYLFITSVEDNSGLSVNRIEDFFIHILERVDFTRDLHFQTQTTMDTLDYSGGELNSGSKLVVAVAGKKRRELGTDLKNLQMPSGFGNPKVVMKGVLVIETEKYSNPVSSGKFIGSLSLALKEQSEINNFFPLIILADDSGFTAKNMNNFLWVTFTRSNPAADVYGVDDFTEFKHWGCRGSLIFDARIKPFHAPPLETNPEVEKRVDALGVKGKSLFGII